MRSPPVHGTRQVLNRALNLQRFSLAKYLRYARPWASEADHVLLAVVFRIAQVQKYNATRIGDLLVERHGSAEPGSFPLHFTGLNDLSIRHLAPLVVKDLQRVIHDLRSCAQALRDDSTALELVEAILRDEERHLQILCEELGHLNESDRADQQSVSILNRRILHPQPNRRPRRVHDVREELVPA